MAQGLISIETVEDIGDAIREQNGLETLYLPNELPVAIRALPVNYPVQLESRVIDHNGTFTPQAGYGGFAKVKVSVKGMEYSAAVTANVLQHRNVGATFTPNFVYTATAEIVEE